jgi:hypothetical protein
LDDYAIWDVFLSAGTWTLDVVYNTAPNGAQATVTVAGTVLSPPIDTFATTPATLDARFTGIVVAQTGITTISQLATGKDTGSTGYTMQVAQYIFTRTA